MDTLGTRVIATGLRGVHARLSVMSIQTALLLVSEQQPGNLDETGTIVLA